MKLRCAGSRCTTSTNTRPVFMGMAPKNFFRASRPPAEAPMPMTRPGERVVSPGRWVLAEERLPCEGPLAAVRRLWCLGTDAMHDPHARVRHARGVFKVRD